MVENRYQDREHHRQCGTGLHHRGFGKPVGEKSGRRKQHNERQQDEPVHNGGKNNLGFAIMDLEDGVLNEDFVPEVDKGIEKHHRDKGGKSGNPEQFDHISSTFLREPLNKSG